MAGQLRVTGGALVRRRFMVPKAADEGLVRPTPDRVREAIFSALLPRLKDAKILDLFAGSGASSIEALSRGAQSAVLVEMSKETAKTIAENIKALGLEKQCQLVVSDALRYVQENKGVEYDVIFADPPYPLLIDPAFFESLRRYLSSDGLVVFRCEKKKPLPAIPQGYKVLREKAYGGTLVYFLALA